MPRHIKLVELLALWTVKAAGRPMPLRSEFTPFDLRPWLGNLALVDLVADALPDGPDFLYRIYGSELAQLLAVEMTGKRISQGEAAFRDQILSEYRAALEAARPFRIARLRRPGKLHNGWEKLILPLSRSGARIDCFLSGMFPPES